MDLQWVSLLIIDFFGVWTEQRWWGRNLMAEQTHTSPCKKLL